MPLRLPLWVALMQKKLLRKPLTAMQQQLLLPLRWKLLLKLLRQHRKALLKKQPQLLMVTTHTNRPLDLSHGIV